MKKHRKKRAAQYQKTSGKIGKMITKLKKELEKNQVVLVILSQEDYAHSAKLVGKLVEGKGCYLTTNKNSLAIIGELTRAKINADNFLFLDCVSKEAELTDGMEGSVFLKSPKDLDEIFSAVSIALKKDFELFVLDSLNSLLMHNLDRPADVVEFASRLANRVRNERTKLIFIAEDTPSQQQFIDDIGIFVDKVIKLS